MTPKQSTENREPHTIRAIHPPPLRDRQASRPIRAGEIGQSDENRKERKTEIMGHRKRLLPSPSPHHLIRPNQSAASSPPSPIISRASRAAHHSPSLPPRPPCRRAGRNNTASNSRHLITLSRPPSASSHSTAPRTATGTATGRRTRHRHRHPSKQGETADIIVSPLPVANKREARTGRDRHDIARITAATERANKQPTAAAPHHRRDKRDGKRVDIRPAAR